MEQLERLAKKSSVPKDALLQWLNDLLQLEESLDDLVSGAAVCQVMDVLGKAARTSQHQDNPSGFPDVVPMKRVNFRARLEHECVKNYKVLQGIFREFGIEEQPNWSTLAQGRSTELLELLRWTHRFCVEHGAYRGVDFPQLAEWGGDAAEEEAGLKPIRLLHSP